MRISTALLLTLCAAVPAGCTPRTAPEVSAPVPAPPDVDDNDSRVFAVAFTDVTDRSARLVFSTAEAAQATVVVRAGNSEVKRIAETEFAEIHRVDIGGLSTGKTYKVDIAAQTQAGAMMRSNGHTMTARLRPTQFDRFGGRTYFGVQHAFQATGPFAELGAGMVRYSPTWDGIQPKPGEFDRKKLDDAVSYVRSLKAMGVEPLILLCYCVDWAQEHTNHQMIWRNKAFGPPDRVEDWKRYVRTVMQELKGLARYYEVWNEPDAGYLAMGVPAERLSVQDAAAIKPVYRDNDDYWLGDRYVPLVMATREVADEIDKDIAVIGGSWNHDYHGRRGDLCFSRGMHRSIQQYSFHNYAGGFQSYPLWEYWTNGKYMVFADAAFKKFGISMPIAITEWNVPSYDTPDKAKGFCSRRDGQIFLVKSAFYYLSLERISMLILHQFGFNDEWSLVWKDDKGEMTRTPSFGTYKWLCKTFSGKRYNRLPIATDGGPDVRAYAIRLADDNSALVALWQDRLDEQTMKPVPLPERTVHVELKGIPNGPCRLDTLDITGNTAGTSEAIAKKVLAWDATLPAATGAAESEPLLYRIALPGSQ